MSHRETDLTRPSRVSGVDLERLADCIEACFTCARACLACAEARLSETTAAEREEVVRIGLGCADLCEATGLLLSRYSSEHANLVRAFLDTCARACLAWADVCGRRAGAHERCHACRDACLVCEQACRDLVAALD